MKKWSAEARRGVDLATKQKEVEVVCFGGFCLDLGRQRLFRDSQQLHLNPKSFKTLTYLVRQRGRTVSKQELLEAIWPETHVTDESIEQAVKLIRQALGDSARNPSFIQTVHRVGYCFIAEVRDLQVNGMGAKAPGSQIAEPALETELTPGPQQESVLASTVPSRVHFSHRPLKTGLLLAGFGVIGAALFQQMSVPPATPRITAIQVLTNSPSIKFAPIVTDGPRIYFTELHDGGYRIAQVHDSGGDSAVLETKVQNPYLADISPENSLLLVRSVMGFRHEDAPLWTIPLVGGVPRRLVESPAYEGSWAPDGKKMVIASGSQLYLADSDGTEPRKLFELDGVPWWTRWSPDGRRIRFTLLDNKTNANSLWEASPDGGSLKPVLPHWSENPSECCGNWTPDGKYFVFQSSHGGSDNIWVMRERIPFLNQDHHEPVRLTFGAISYRGPVSSRDGKSIFVKGTLLRGEVSRYDAHSDAWLPFLPDVSIETMDVSNEGKWIAYTTLPENTLWMRRREGSEKIQLTYPPTRAALPQWSPDGSRIVFMARDPGRPWKLALVPRSESRWKELTTEERSEADPSWAPNGARIVFGRLPAVEPAPQDISLHWLDLETGVVATVPGSKGLFSPRWSPDGRHLCALTHDATKLKLYDLRTGAWTDLVNGKVGCPAWSRDGRVIYFLDLTEGGICRVAIAGASVQKLKSLKGLRQPPSTFGTWMGLAQDDSPLVIRDLSSQQIYALEWEAP
ncbi:MAG: winged helix-turn-helix domain-containing protein [Acidobacteriota bacterium]